MGKRYAATVTTDTNNPTRTGIAIVGSSTARPRIYDVLVSSNETPADQALEFIFQRLTAIGSGSDSVTPVALDPAEPSSTAVVRGNYENADTDPTYTASAVVLLFAMNQRSTQRWVASPGGELICPATANNGIGQQNVFAGTAIGLKHTIHFEE